MKKPAPKPAPKPKAKEPVKPKFPLPEARCYSLLVQLGANRRNLTELLNGLNTQLGEAELPAMTDELAMALVSVEEAESFVIQQSKESYPQLKLPVTEEAWFETQH